MELDREPKRVTVVWRILKATRTETMGETGPWWQLLLGCGHQAELSHESFGLSHGEWPCGDCEAIARQALSSPGIAAPALEH